MFRGLRFRHSLPLLVGAYPVCFLFVTNLQEVMGSLDPYHSLFEIVGVVFTLSALIHFTLAFFLKNHDKAALLTATFLVLLLGYGHLRILFSSLGLRGQLPALLFSFVAWGTLSYMIFRTNFKLAGVCGKLCVFSVIAIGLLGVQAFSSTSSSKELEQKAKTSLRFHKIEKPDVYHLVFDEYAHRLSLRDYGYDNSAFESELEKRGFYLPKRSHSNYAWTNPSVSSTLSLDYLGEFSPMEGPLKGAPPPEVFRLTSKSRVHQTFRELGYDLGLAAATYPFTLLDRDVLLSCPVFNNFQYAVIRTSLLSLVESRISDTLGWTATLRRNYNCFFEQLAKSRSHKGPKYVFGHLLSPHPPFMFDAKGNVPRAEVSGNPLLLDTASRAEMRAPYLEQLQYLNTSILQLIDSLMAQESKPIIILHSDHGGQYSDQFPERWKNFDSAAIQERFHNLVAVFGPDELLSKYYDDVSNVNLFRILFTYFGLRGFEPLPDRTFHSLAKTQFFDFTEVSLRSGNQVH